MPWILAVLLMPPARETHLKSFDYAQDTTKQLLTLATGVVTITVAFMKDSVATAPTDARCALFAGWILLAVSVLGGVGTLMNLTGEVQRAGAATSQGIYKTAVRVMASVQILAFAVALICVIYFGVRVPSTRAGSTLSGSAQTTPTVTTASPGGPLEAPSHAPRQTNPAQ